MKYFLTCSLFSADVHSLLPIKNNKIVTASNKSSIGMSECGLKMILLLLLSGITFEKTCILFHSGIFCGEACR